MREVKRRKRGSYLTEEQKARKRERYYAKWEEAKQYREQKKLEKAAYDQQRRLEKREHLLEVNKKHYERVKHTEKYKKVRRDYQVKYKPIANAKNRIRNKQNPDKVAAKAARRRASKRKATPLWLTKEHIEEIQEFYTLAQELKWLNEGEVLHVDHIVPLRGNNVCGLHVPWNLQLLPAEKNLSKNNKLLV